MTTATRTLDLSCPALGPGPGLQHGQNELMLNTLLFSIEHKKCFYYGNMQIMRKHFPFQKILQGPEIIVSALRPDTACLGYPQCFD